MSNKSDKKENIENIEIIEIVEITADNLIFDRITRPKSDLDYYSEYVLPKRKPYSLPPPRTELDKILLQKYLEQFNANE
jgi:hypothetical protein